MGRSIVTLSAKRRTCVINEPEAPASTWAASLHVRLQEASGPDGFGQRALDLVSGSLTSQNLKSYADKLSQFAEFCHAEFSENIGSLGATIASFDSDVVLDYIDPNVPRSPGAWFFFGHISRPFATSKSNKTPQQWLSRCPFVT
eukprot:jgi/Tetstr1/447890/TSEL_035199.t1